MFTDPTFWFLVSFVLFFVFFGGAIWSAVTTGLDTRSKGIENDIQEAIKLREQAQEMLNDIEKKQQEAGKHAEAIIEHARLEAERLRSESAKELSEYIKNKESLIKERIEFAEQEALKDMRDTAIRMAVEASTKIMHNVVTKELGAALADKSIEELASAK